MHANRALELIERARGAVPTMRALGIYCRMHFVAGAAAEVLANRVLARLGDRADGGGRLAAVDEQTDEWDTPRSWLKRLRSRLRGRINPELRLWLELHAARTEVELLRAHVEGAVRVIEVLKPTGSFAAAVEFYTTSMGVRPSISQAVYFFTLTRLAGDDPGARAAPPRDAGKSPPTAASQALRIVME